MGDIKIKDLLHNDIIEKIIFSKNVTYSKYLFFV